MIDYLNLQSDPNAWTLDIETDGLNPTVIWVCCVKNIVTGETRSFRNAEDFKRFHNRSFTYIGHNILSFDAPVLNRIWNVPIDLASCTDTLTLSYLYNPSLAEGHSLEAWGQRLKFPKIEFNDWSNYSEEMESYCLGDVELTSRVYKALSEKMKRIGYSNLSCSIEHKIRVVIDQQEKNGFYFNAVGAKDFRTKLLERQSHLSEKIQQLFPKRLEAIAEYRFRRTKDGSPFAQYEKHRNKYPKLEHFTTSEGEFYRVFDWVEFNIGSPKQRVERLQEVGWEPDQFTPKGFPKVDEDSLERFVEKLKKASDNRYEAIEAMAEWLVIQGRASMVETWLGYVQPDSRIHGRVLTCGANSRRCRHFEPNSANIPSPHKAKWGKETRGFWGVEPNKGLIEVGVDASGLENVCLLHYLNNPKANEVMNRKKPDDIHTMNARNLSNLLGKEVDREWGAKTSLYAALFGAYPPKIAQALKCSVAEGAKARELLVGSIPGLDRLIKDVTRTWKKNGGRIPCIDGGWVICPSENACLNYLIQPTGACVMKLADIILHEEASKQGLLFKQVAFVHDEFQLECREEDGDRLGKLAVWSIEEAARQLGFKVGLTGEYKTGKDWSECH